MKKKFYGSQLISGSERVTYKVAIRRGYCENFGTDEWKYSFVGQFLRKYPNRCKILDIMSDMLGHHPNWEDLTDKYLRDLKERFASNMCASTLRTTLAMIKSVINDNKSSVDIPVRESDRILRSKKQDSQAVYLTEEEIERINQYVPENDIERYVKKIFLIGCYTLARHSDCVKMTLGNVYIKNRYITYVSQKTKHNHVIPLHKNLEKYLSDDISLDIHDNVFNDTIRDICRKCGIDEMITIFRRGKESTLPKWKFISSHTARRSAATNLYLRNVEILQLSKMMGHSSVAVTQKYIVGYKELDDTTLGYFYD